MQAPELIQAAPANVAPPMEVISTADSFCDAYDEMVALYKHSLAVAKSRSLLGANEFVKAEHFLNLPKVNEYIDRAITNGRYSPLLADEQMRSYIQNMARQGVLGNLVQQQKDRAPHTVSRGDFEKILAMNHSLTDFASSEYAQQIGFGRRHLKKMLSAILGQTPESEAVKALERGLATEVATFLYLSEHGKQYGMEVRHSDNQEEMHKVDFVCQQGHKKLEIQTKSKDIVAQQSGSYSDQVYIEDGPGLHEYRARDLSPANDSAIKDNFSVLPGYQRKMENLLAGFAAKN